MMYYIGDNSTSVDGDDKRIAPNKKSGWSLEYEAPLESSFMFEAEGAGFFRVKNADEKADKSVSTHDCAPIAVF
ncbi:hypothetical protein GALL_499730 [mine drainage metagenome]|uniref:Uncharacterized protein n=1 Tax=mine drainage metagenome TaxID=410659 RepID=A0A1J5PB46_9ZZZZ